MNGDGLGCTQEVLMDGGGDDPVRRREALALHYLADDPGVVARRARRQAGALGAAALAVAGIVASVQLLAPGGDAPSPAPPVVSPSAPDDPPTAAPTDAAVDLAGTVDADDAGLLDIATTPADPERRITVWRGREEQHWVLALTADGFAHRRLLEVSAGTSATPIGGGRFMLRDGWEGRELSIIDVEDGSSTPVRISRAKAPVAGDEVPVVLLDGASSTLAAVAPDGSGHEVPTPAGASDLRAYAGRLTAVQWHEQVMTYHWSDDGGATWHATDLAGSFLPEVARAGAGSPHAVIEGGDGATLFPPEAVDTASATDPGSWTRHPIDRGDHGLTSSGAWIDRDGGLRMLAAYWDEDGRKVREAGVWQVVDGRLAKVVSDRPDLTDVAEVGLLTVEDDGGPVLWVASHNGSAWRSIDDGSTWERFPAR